MEDGARQVYPEYSFNFYVDDGEKEEFKKRFHFETAADDAEFWVNGQADLVVKTFAMAEENITTKLIHLYIYVIYWLGFRRRSPSQIHFPFSKNDSKKAKF